MTTKQKLVNVILLEESCDDPREDVAVAVLLTFLWRQPHLVFRPSVQMKKCYTVGGIRREEAKH